MGDPVREVGGLDVRLSLPSLLRGHVWIRELTISDPTVRIVRQPSNELNISDLLGRSETSEKRVDVTVDHFRLERGTTTLVDQALAEPRTWTSEQMTIEAHNVSTRLDSSTMLLAATNRGPP